ncbi:MAG: hypothetical protein U0166_14610 [Acidobacteriota bacterium]
MRWALFTLAGLALVWAVLTEGLYRAMCQPPERFAQIMKHVPLPMMMVLPFQTLWNRARGGALSVGDAAPDFDLETSDKTARVRLSSFRGEKPVVLVFGSYT